MQKTSKFLTIAFLFAGMLTLPVLMSGNYKKIVKSSTSRAVTGINTAAVALEAEATSLYDSLALNGDITVKTLAYALKGFKYLKEKNMLGNNNVLSICDFSQSSRKKRLYIIDVEHKKLLLNTYVAHGRNSGNEYATTFSNDENSHKSSLGFYITETTYSGSHGLSLRIQGIEKGFNDRADSRAVVVHGCDYLGDRFIQHNPFSGRSWGCPAVPSNETPKVIKMIKDGSCLFIFHPTEDYIKHSKILNA